MVAQNTIARPAVFRVSVSQILLAAAVSAALFVVAGVSVAQGFALGCMIEIAGRAYFGFYAFRYAGARQMPLVARSFRQGMIGKFILQMLLFGWLFWQMRDINAAAVFAGYAGAWLYGTLVTQRLLK